MKKTNLRGLGLLAALGLFVAGCCTTAKQELSNPIAPVINIPTGSSAESVPVANQHPFTAVLAPVDNASAHRAERAPTMQVLWTFEGLLVEVRVNDTTPNEAEALAELFKGDSVELFVGREEDRKQFYQVIISPGMTGAAGGGGQAGGGEPRVFFVDHRMKLHIPLVVDVGRVKHTDGYTLKVLLPWANLDVHPVLGQQARLQVFVNDYDNFGQGRRNFWYPALDSFINPDSMYAVRLSQQAGPAMRVAAWGEFKQFRQTDVVVLADSGLVGKPVTLSNGAEVLAKSELAAKNGQSGTEFRLPVSTETPSYPALTVQVAGEAPVLVKMPKLTAQMRVEAFQRVELRFKTGPAVYNEVGGAVFTGTVLPQPYFENPVDVEDLIGPFTITTRFFDADYQEVTKAGKMGRYGAVVTIQNAQGQTWTRYSTLFKMKEPLKDVRTIQIPVTGPLPASIGLDPLVVEHQSNMIAESYKSFFLDSIRRDNRVAVMLAALYEAAPNDPPTVDRTNAAARDSKWWFPLKQKLGVPLYRYMVTMPEGMDKEPGKKWPLIVFLHGSGERGEDLKLVAETTYGMPYHIKKMKDLPFIVVSPQCSMSENWNPAELNAFLDNIIAKYPVDMDRVYLSGVSMGGFGCWNWGQDSPERFAAIAPVCGGGDKNDVERIKNLPIWVFHGDADMNVPIKADVECVKALHEVQGRVRFTIYPGGGHDAATPTYKNPKFYEWLLQQKRGEPGEPVGGTTGPATMPTNNWKEGSKF